MYFLINDNPQRYYLHSYKVSFSKTSRNKAHGLRNGVNFLLLFGIDYARDPVFCFDSSTSQGLGYLHIAAYWYACRPL